MAQTSLTNQSKMAAFTQGLPTGLINLHSSHPAALNQQQLTDIVHLDAPAFIEALSLDYAPVIGSSDIRQAIVDAHYSDTHADDILTTCGAQEAIFITMQAVLQKGDQVVCLTPIFEPLYQQAKMIGADIHTVPLLSDQAWAIDWPALKQAVNHHTRMLIINFPHNPTGSHINQDELNQLLELCRQHDCWLLSDEVFRGLEHQSNQRLPAAVDCYDKAISIAVMSKAYGMPGIRLGWIACRQHEMRKRMINVKRHLSICGSRLDEVAASQLIPLSDKIFTHHRKQLNQNRQLLANSLAHLPHLQCHLPQAGATCFVQIWSKHSISQSDSGEDFARQLALDKGILVLPDVCFLTDVSGFRLSIGHTDTAEFYNQLHTN
ncbi:pyridoxal phosphate-dependent aminotransferase [Marinicella gelatinilytica]|uniref:pyridoxal phosphate-dependent aminotransferase n=1 Tax=Marinicella gelatinilytica TaxID=2996017 RepID=UPI002260DE2C|nr:pyridoxal phosphate-dependent aminotransferase [Marinicella gelatinilytica]MCX7544010.1 pyridoxal phosphate-dependent aminotransferase [Marinicella gelatinilytica]